MTIYRVSPGNLELNSATGRIMLAVLSEFDHEENVSRAMNVSNGLLKAAMAGSWQGAVPYAYQIEGASTTSGCYSEMTPKSKTCSVCLRCMLKGKQPSRSREY